VRKYYLTVNDVSKKTNVSVYTLRYWEKVFKGILIPERSTGNQRRYSYDDIELIFIIKKLLKEELYTIAGAKKILEKTKRKK